MKHSKSHISKIVEADVLVVGGGAAGIAAAIEAAKYGVDVALTDKGKVGFSGSASTSGAGTCAVFLENDSYNDFIQETIEGGEYLSVRELVEVLVEEGTLAVQKLNCYDVPYERDANGQYKLFRQMGQKLPRTPFITGGGPAMMLALRKEALHRGVRFYEDVMANELTMDGKSVTGCLAIQKNNGENILFSSKAVILAAGSATDLYPYTTASYKTTGDGYWLAWHAGLEFINMEFVEFSVMPAPNGVALSSGGIKPLTARGAKFVNARGERFMERYDPERKELAKRGTIVYGIYREIKEGRGPVYMDATEISDEDFYTLENVEKRGILLRLKNVGVDYKRERFEWVSPAVHTFLGGVMVTPQCRTPIAGLYVVGENAGGIYGADRIGTYLTACAVFGFRAGKEAARSALNTVRKEISSAQVAETILKLRTVGKKRDGLDPTLAKKKLKEIAGRHIACERTESGLKAAIQKFETIMEDELYTFRINGTEDYINVLEIRNLCLTGRLVAEAALRRRETRGQHRRVDHPHKDSAYLKHIVLQHQNGKVSARDIVIP